MKVSGPIREANPCVLSHFTVAPPQVGWNPPVSPVVTRPRKVGWNPNTNVVGYASGITSGRFTLRFTPGRRRSLFTPVRGCCV